MEGWPSVAHVIIEYSANLASAYDIQSLVDEVHQAALDDGLVPLDGLRTRAVARDHYRIADGDPGHVFVAVTARIGPGRSEEARRRFLERLIETVDGALAAVEDRHAVALSVEVQEIDADFRINRNHVRTKLQESADGR